MWRPSGGQACLWSAYKSVGSWRPAYWPICWETPDLRGCFSKSGEVISTWVINLVGNVPFFSQINWFSVIIYSLPSVCIMVKCMWGVWFSVRTLRPPKIQVRGVTSYTPTLCSSSQRPGTATGEVAAADADVAPPTKGHWSRAWAQRLLQGPGWHIKPKGEHGGNRPGPTGHGSSYGRNAP